ncbi:50S ribosomal protein L19 [Candidatus Phytoplasma oryzae]|nr:50S ribosomal protein L19 [Candidatus Phytoplasma oryzae]
MNINSKGTEIINFINKENLRKTTPFKVGDTIRVFVKFEENNKKKIQIFEGLVIKKKGINISETFTLRNVYSGIGVERICPLHSPLYDRIEVIKRGLVRRSKLYYIRNLSSKATKIKEKR